MNDILKAKKRRIIKETISNKDWVLRDANAVVDTTTMLYLYDNSSEDTIGLFGFTPSNIADLGNLISTDFSIDDICDSVTFSINEFMCTKNKQPKSMLSDLGMLLGLYMINTQTFKVLEQKEKKDNLHKQFVVVRYNNEHTGECVLRPLAFLSENMVNSSSEIHSLILPLINRDKQVNPHYFPSSPVTPIFK